MSEHIYPPQSHELSKKRRDLAPETDQAFRAFSKQVFSDGALSSMEAIWVGAEMRAGAAYAHMIVAMDSLTEMEQSETTPRTAKL